MTKQQEKFDKVLGKNLIKLVLSICALIILIVLSYNFLLGFLHGIKEHGIGIMYITYLYMPYVVFFAFALIVGLICVGTIYDFVSYPKKLKKIKEALKDSGKIPIKINIISKKNAKKDSDLFQAYIIKWRFVSKNVPYIKTETIFYSDEPDFIFKYRDKEATIEYNDKYFSNYKLNLPVENLQ